MKWLEIINIQAADGSEDKVKAQVEKVMDQLATESINEGLIDLKVFLNNSVKGNMVIHLHWEVSRAEKRESLLGLSLYQSLKPFGLTHHSVWEEQRNICTVNNQIQTERRQYVDKLD